MTKSRSELLTQIQGAFRDVFELDDFLVDEAVSKESFEAWDSLGHIRLVSALEEALGVSFTLEEIESMSSVAQIVAILENKLR